MLASLVAQLDQVFYGALRRLSSNVTVLLLSPETRN